MPCGETEPLNDAHWRASDDAPGSERRGDDALERLVERQNGLDDGVEARLVGHGVRDHVGVGKVGEDVADAVAHAALEQVGDLGGAHLRRFDVRRHLARLDDANRDRQRRVLLGEHEAVVGGAGSAARARTNKHTHA